MKVKSNIRAGLAVRLAAASGGRCGGGVGSGSNAS